MHDFGRLRRDMRTLFDKKYRHLALIIIFSLFIVSFGAPVEVRAEETKTGVVTCSATGTVNTRESASTSAAIINKLANGKPLVILEETTGADGYVWYRVSYVLDASGETKTAYIRSDFVTITNQQTTAAAQTVIATGTINATNVYVRDAAGTSGTNILVALNSGHQVNIIGQTTVSGGTWYQITCSVNGVNYTGWTYAPYVTINYTAAAEGDYADELRGKGFPESYIPALCALHEKYPSWSFEAVNTGIDWNTAVVQESTNGKNLVQNSEDDAKKSTAAGAYDWNTNTWTIYDSGTWVSANQDYIAYCMDPRNFLDEESIFMFENLGYSDNQNLTGVQAILKDSFMSGDFSDADGKVYNYAQSFLDIGKSVGASPYYLASRVRQEQGTAGTSALISGKYAGYEGYFNYFNYGAYGSTDTVVIQSGLSTAKRYGWNSRYASLSGGAKLIAANYINVGQNTIYFQKFNVVSLANLYSHQYMANVTAAITEGRKVAAGYTDKNQAFVFRIPVFNNMPDRAVTFTASGNPNNYLKTLSLSGLSLTPSFTAGTTSYSVVVGNSVSSVAVSASPVASTSTVTGTGSYNLAVGSNTIKVNCKSKSGDTRIYTITVVRQAADTSNTGTALSSSKYTVGSYITGVAPGTSAADFVSGVSVSQGTVKLLTAAGAENTGTVGTGNKAAVYNSSGTLVATYEIVVYGDLNGDGAVNALDMIKLNRHIIGISSLSGAYLQAADTNRKGDGVNALDMIVLNRHIIGQTTIQQ